MEGAEVLERCRLRWVVDMEEEMARGRFRDLLPLLPEPDQKTVLTFLQPADQHRALLSRLLQRCAVATALGADWASIAIATTRGRKPFTTNTKPPEAPCWNYNGRFVILAADPLRLVGADVAAPRSSRPGGAGRPLAQHLAAFRGQMAESEWALLHGPLAGDEGAQEAGFQRLWSLKESFIKARGDGLGFQPLSRAAFSFPAADPWARTALLRLDGSPHPGWSFELHALPSSHCAAVALGPPAEAVDAWGLFRASLGLGVGLDGPDGGVNGSSTPNGLHAQPEHCTHDWRNGCGSQDSGHGRVPPFEEVAPLVEVTPFEEVEVGDLLRRARAHR
ncbi:hypothetical protein HYH03_008433 [Edaphochlamys debaryana]|uniref:holo-[acyl-carrier-protein] synthase n=1 Tax=Edaphochlamys debaryana TaxID=47281 RepID=A0A835Y131_9CHLO|nr:hypothetical protein HYH03_008433 [Edaphochlamys debaryana]|eukprot:KAG2493297.1 hypothetical protein HYH03_008433 [Edaphochlamys debaryana]